MEEQFNLWREEMPRLVRDLLESVMPGMIESAIEKTLQEKFVPRAELEEMLEVQRHAADEKYATQSIVNALANKNAELEGRLSTMESMIHKNTSGIEALRRFTETTLSSIQSSVTSIQQSFQATTQTLTQSLQAVIDRQGAQTVRSDSLEKRVTANEDALDKVRDSVRGAEIVNEDLRTRIVEALPPLQSVVFGGQGHKGLVLLVEGQAAQMQPILTYLEELKRRDETNRQRVESAKAIAASALKNWKAWAVGIPAGTAITTVVTAALNNPTSQEIIALLAQLLGGN